MRRKSRDRRVELHGIERRVEHHDVLLRTQRRAGCPTLIVLAARHHEPGQENTSCEYAHALLDPTSSRIHHTIADWFIDS
jgi:hypothetical protein